jgi:cytoskeletal protein RodZ
MDTDPHRDDQLPNSTPQTPEQRAATEAEDRQARIEYLRSLTPEKKRKPVWLRIVLTVVVIAIVGGIAALLYIKLVDTKKDDGKDAQTTASKNAQQKKVADTPVKATKTYSSTTFNLSIMYPDGWVPAEGDNKLTITSPATSFANASGKTITGQIIVSLNAKGQNLTPFDSGNATAVLDSEKLTYTQPTSVQRAQTYLSFAQYPTTTATGAIDALYVTGDYGYQKGQAIPKVDMANLDPLISVNFLSCSDAKCTKTAPVPIAASNWTNKVFSTPITSTLESLAVN